MKRLSNASNAVRWLGVGLAVLVCFTFWHRATAIGRTPSPANAAAEPAVKAQDPRVWAGVSASVPGATTNAMFSVGEVNRLVIGVALVNDGDAPIPFDRAATRLVINGEPVELFDGNGPVWNEVRPGRPFGASTGGVARHFAQPGLYKIQWKGEGFSSSVLEIRVTED
jgi:hypothetical protein